MSSPTRSGPRLDDERRRKQRRFPRYGHGSTKARTDQEPFARLVDRALGIAENLLYCIIGVRLVGAAVAVLSSIAYHLITDTADGAEHAVIAALSGLLLVFILVELLAAVRATVTEHKLVAEPFLVVGIIALIKEIVVVSLEAKDKTESAFDDAMLEIGVLGALVLALAVALLLIRRREREPEEGGVAGSA